MDRAVPDSAACPPIIPNLVVTAQTAAITLVVFVAVVAFIYWVVTADLSGEGVNRALLRLAAIAGGAILGILVAIVVVPPVAIVDYSAFPAEPLALIVAVALAFLAVFVATARDARRFVIGIVTAAVGWFLVVYPNFSALPLPTVVANAFQGVLPTYPYPFQFPSNRCRGREGRQAARPGRARAGGRGRAALPRAGLLGVGLADRPRRARGGGVGRVGRVGGRGRVGGAGRVGRPSAAGGRRRLGKLRLGLVLERRGRGG